MEFSDLADRDGCKKEEPEDEVSILESDNTTACNILCKPQSTLCSDEQEWTSSFPATIVTSQTLIPRSLKTATESVTPQNCAEKCSADVSDLKVNTTAATEAFDQPEFRLDPELDRTEKTLPSNPVKEENSACEAEQTLQPENNLISIDDYKLTQKKTHPSSQKLQGEKLQMFDFFASFSKSQYRRFIEMPAMTDKNFKLCEFELKDIVKIYNRVSNYFTPASELFTYPLTALASDEPDDVAELDMTKERDRLRTFYSNPQYPLGPGQFAIPLAQKGYFMDKNSGRITCFYCGETPENHRPSCNQKICSVPFSDFTGQPPHISKQDRLQMMGATPKRERQADTSSEERREARVYMDRSKRLESFRVHRPTGDFEALASAGFYAVGRETLQCFSCGLQPTAQQLNPPSGMDASDYILAMHQQLSPQCEFAAQLLPPPGPSAAGASCAPPDPPSLPPPPAPTEPTLELPSRLPHPHVLDPLRPLPPPPPPSLSAPPPASRAPTLELPTPLPPFPALDPPQPFPPTLIPALSHTAPPAPTLDLSTPLPPPPLPPELDPPQHLPPPTPPPSPPPPAPPPP